MNRQPNGLYEGNILWQEQDEQRHRIIQAVETGGKPKEEVPERFRESDDIAHLQFKIDHLEKQLDLACKNVLRLQDQIAGLSHPKP